MKRVSYRTLVLLLMLLGLIILQQHTAKAVCAKSDAVWLADDPNDPPVPPPEYTGTAALPARFDTDDPNDPPAPPEFV